MTKQPSLDQATLRTMGALVRQPPKPHDQMKIGKAKGKAAKSPAKQKIKPR